MANSKEYLRELLKRAIPEKSGETVNYRELRTLLEASIENQRSSIAVHSANDTQREDFGFSENEKQTTDTLSEAEKGITSTEEMTSGASGNESIEESDASKPNESTNGDEKPVANVKRSKSLVRKPSIRSKGGQPQVKPRKTEKAQSSKKNEQKSQSTKSTVDEKQDNNTISFDTSRPVAPSSSPTDSGELKLTTLADI